MTSDYPNTADEVVHVIDRGGHEVDVPPAAHELGEQHPVAVDPGRTGGGGVLVDHEEAHAAPSAGCRRGVSTRADAARCGSQSQVPISDDRSRSLRKGAETPPKVTRSGGACEKVVEDRQNPRTSVEFPFPTVPPPGILPL